MFLQVQRSAGWTTVVTCRKHQWPNENTTWKCLDFVMFIYVPSPNQVWAQSQLGHLEPYLGVLFGVIYEYKHCDNHYKLRYQPYNYGYMYVYFIMMYINSRNFTPSTELLCFWCFYGIDIWIGQVSQDSGRAFRYDATHCFDGLLQPELRYYQLYYHKWWFNHYKWWLHGDFHGLRMG